MNLTPIEKNTINVFIIELNKVIQKVTKCTTYEEVQNHAEELGDFFETNKASNKFEELLTHINNTLNKLNP